MVVRVGPLSPDRVACRRPLVCHRPTNPRRAQQRKGGTRHIRTPYDILPKRLEGKESYSNPARWPTTGLQPQRLRVSPRNLLLYWNCTEPPLGHVRNRASSVLGNFVRDGTLSSGLISEMCWPGSIERGLSLSRRVNDLSRRAGTSIVQEIWAHEPPQSSYITPSGSVQVATHSYHPSSHRIPNSSSQGTDLHLSEQHAKSHLSVTTKITTPRPPPTNTTAFSFDTLCRHPQTRCASFT